METWGELFWDAWIRLRLWFRSLYRTYWPPQFKAWQICTVTGIVSIILTLVALNYQPGSKKLLAEHQNEAAPKKTAVKKSKLTAKTVVPKEDPFGNLDPQANAAPTQDL
ncbi:MAG: hypothetical protein V4719_22400, partial [Planctomycetota bacterium]